jgi:TetR/AcrR family transcriptional repressor of nem operon
MTFVMASSSEYMMNVMQNREAPMRGTSQQKAETRRRIMDAASRLFRREGIDGVGVDAVMRQAGLTHGGFYGHFPSKESLAAEVCAEQLSRSAARWEAMREEHGAEQALARIVESYLSAAHVEQSERSCVVPTLGAELARRPGAHPALTSAIRAMVDTLASCLPRRRAPARERALAGLSCMVGAVVLARLSSDPGLSEEILEAARKAVLPAAPP